ncbi:Peptidoglycan-associated lipoprotein precursor [Luteitalea pratensis]|uniref:Peptidoglycan-associated lipoprotein n=1 Tax=Luteitalea pratensis TaxID=1855912 RepID=A0A143PPJ2_LUTPR|nr:peptidoglycan-associated lipoprotein Pal [Luteitalea pratensis]AMY10286.1 Peptidoglycan-associated lipoprotein precursor [Luteitalea pratensis]
MSVRPIRLAALLMVIVATTSACSRKKPPVARPTPPPPSATTNTGGAPPPPPAPLREPEPVSSVPAEPAISGTAVDYNARSLDELNRESPLQPVYYALDSADVAADMQGTLTKNSEVLRQYPSWVVTVEGHCDERGTAEYNLALGERRAQAARAYLISLGIPAERIKIVSYGKEFPFDPGTTEEAYAKNRRAHFVVTSK